MEATEKQPDNPNVVGIIVIGAAGSLLVIILFIALQAYYTAGASALQAVREAEEIDFDRRKVQADQETLLKELRWLDQGKRTARIGIESAMKAVVADAAADRGATLVPAVGAHDTPTVPAIPGRPADNAQVPVPAAGTAPADGTAPATGTTPASGTGTTPFEGTPTDGTTPAPATAPAAGQATAPAPAAPAPAAEGAAEGNEQQ
jgi:hypothetical protein